MYQEYEYNNHQNPINHLVDLRKWLTWEAEAFENTDPKILHWFRLSHSGTCKGKCADASILKSVAQADTFKCCPLTTYMNNIINRRISMENIGLVYKGKQYNVINKTVLTEY